MLLTNAFSSLKYIMEGENMKVLFVDFDGVLNSEGYRDDPDLYLEAPIEPAKMPLLKRIKDATDCKIVLTTSWREYWSYTGEHTDRIGTFIDKIFSDFGMRVTGKTPERNFFRRDEEVDFWLRDHHFTKVESYCILDDLDELFYDDIIKKHLIVTNAQTGITDDDVRRAIEILNGGIS